MKYSWLVASLFMVPLAALGEGFEAGVCTHFSQRKGVLDRNIEMIVAAGATSIRDELPWSQVERERGKLEIPERHVAYIDAARKAGLEVMVILAYGNRLYDDGGKPKSQEAIAAYANYCRFVVTQLKGKVRQYEVWNEYNIGIGTPKNEAGSPENYLKMLEVAARAIREADPKAVVIGGVTAPQGLVEGGWFDRACEMGMVKHCDAVSVHPYIYGQPGAGRTPETWLKSVQRLEGVVRKHADGREIPILVTETGWPTHSGRGASPAPLSADFLARMYLSARTLPALKGVWWYDFQDDGWDPADPEDMFGMVRPDFTPKPSYFAFQAVAPVISGAVFEGREDTTDDSLWLLKFRKKDGSRVLAAWSTLEQPNAVQVRLTAPVDTPAVTVTLVGRPAVKLAWSHREWVGQAATAPVMPGTLSLTATGTPLLVDIGHADVKLESVVRRTVRPTTQPTTAPAN